MYKTNSEICFWKDIEYTVNVLCLMYECVNGLSSALNKIKNSIVSNK